MSDVDVFAFTTQNRLRIVDLLDALDPEDWQVPTLCAGWTVRELAGHLLQPVLVGFGRFAWTSLRYRGDVDRTVDHFARRLAQRPVQDIVALLRQHAADRIDPPRVGPWGPFADSCIHLRDLARPLAKRLAGRDVDVPREHWELLLDYLVSPSVAPALVPPGRLQGLALEATDSPWRHGVGTPVRGAPVRGTLEALAMAACGRAVVLPELDGDGVAVLAERLR